MAVPPPDQATQQCTLGRNVTTLASYVALSKLTA